MSPLIVFSHLRWNFVYQRPQHLMTRLAEHYRVVFFEEPVYDPGEAHLEQYEAAPNVLVVRPHTPVQAQGFHDDQLPVLGTLLERLIESRGLHAHTVWMYTPMALPLLQKTRPQAVIYDCMDELSAFRNAPRQLLQRESALLKLANVVFTGGPSLYRAKRDRHPNAHCFSSSVDAGHFSRARDPAIEHPLMAALPRPRLGFFGVLDERIDMPLVEALADARPDWQIVLVGPVVKISEDSVPRRPNIHRLGQQPYEELPRFLAGWDACLLPFARNEATRYISPTKTLEYMAADLPIISTPITDVAEPYGHVVELADDTQGFVAACERALCENAERRATRLAAYRDILAGTSWDHTVRQMRDLIEEARSAGLNAAAREMLERPASQDAPPRGHQLARHLGTVVMGAGPTGLSCAYHLDPDTLLLDQNPQVGGWCRSVHDQGFTFDYAGHIMFSNDPYVLDLYERLLGDNVHWQDREAWIYSKGVYTRYPFQGALYGLPPEVIRECIVGAIEARFGPIKHGQGAAKPDEVCKAESLGDCCGDGLPEINVPLGASANDPGAPKPRNFEEFIYQVWGAGIAKHFAVPYNRKLWAVPLAEMETSWLGGRVPMPDLTEMIDGALQPVPKPMGPNARFGYPLRGGFQALMNGFLPHLRCELKLNARVVRVSAQKRTVTLADGSTYGWDNLVSTLPLPVLVKAMGGEVPADVRAAADKLRHVSVRCVNLGVRRENVTDKHWIYYPEDTVFHRIFVQGNASPHCNAPGGFGLTCEITYSPYKPLPCDGEALIRRCIDDCIRTGMLRPDDEILAANQVDMPFAYVVYDHARAASVKRIREWMAGHDIVLAGRYSEWEYYNSDHAFIAGRRAAEQVKQQGRRVSASAGAGLRSA